jgi:hypothetical protein
MAPRFCALLDEIRAGLARQYGAIKARCGSTAA